MSSVIITKSSQKKDKRQVNLEREYRDCIKSRRDKIGITRHNMMHQVLYIVQFAALKKRRQGRNSLSNSFLALSRSF